MEVQGLIVNSSQTLILEFEGYILSFDLLEPKQPQNGCKIDENVTERAKGPPMYKEVAFQYINLDF